MWLWDYLYYKWRERNRAAGGFLDFGRVVFWMVACLVAGTLLGLDAMGGDTRAWKDLWFYAVVFLPAVACALWADMVYESGRRKERVLRRFWGKDSWVVRVPPDVIVALMIVLPMAYVVACAYWALS